MNIAIITAGTDSERDISIQSAHHIKNNINFAEAQDFMYPEQWGDFLQEKDIFDIIIPIIHGKGGEDGALQRKLDEYKIPYIFSQPDAHQICFDKKKSKEALVQTSVLFPKTYSHEDMITNNNISYPVIAKPCSGGSSIGLFVLQNHADFLKYDFASNYLFEEYITGHEFTIGVIDFNESVQVLPIMEAKKDSQVFDFNQKYSAQSAEIEVFPTDLSRELEEKLKTTALFVHNHFGLSDISRTDVMVDQYNSIYFIEVNTIPGMTEKSWIPKMLDKAGISFSEVLKYWIKASR